LSGSWGGWPSWGRIGVHPFQSWTRHGAGSPVYARLRWAGWCGCRQAPFRCQPRLYSPTRMLKDLPILNRPPGLSCARCSAKPPRERWILSGSLQTVPSKPAGTQAPRIDHPGGSCFWTVGCRAVCGGVRSRKRHPRHGGVSSSSLGTQPSRTWGSSCRSFRGRDRRQLQAERAGRDRRWIFGAWFTFLDVYFLRRGAK